MMVNAGEIGPCVAPAVSEAAAGSLVAPGSFGVSHATRFGVSYSTSFGVSHGSEASWLTSVSQADRRQVMLHQASQMSQDGWSDEASCATASALVFTMLDRHGHGFVNESQVLPIWPMLARHVDCQSAEKLGSQLLHRATPIGMQEWMEIMSALRAVVGARRFRVSLRRVQEMLGVHSRTPPEGFPVVPHNTCVAPLSLPGFVDTSPKSIVSGTIPFSMAGPLESVPFCHGTFKIREQALGRPAQVSSSTQPEHVTLAAPTPNDAAAAAADTAPTEAAALPEEQEATAAASPLVGASPTADLSAPAAGRSLEEAAPDAFSRDLPTVLESGSVATHDSSSASSRQNATRAQNQDVSASQPETGASFPEGEAPSGLSMLDYVVHLSSTVVPNRPAGYVPAVRSRTSSPQADGASPSRPDSKAGRDELAYPTLEPGGSASKRLSGFFSDIGAGNVPASQNDPALKIDLPDSSFSSASSPEKKTGRSPERWKPMGTPRGISTLDYVVGLISGPPTPTTPIEKMLDSVPEEPLETCVEDSPKRLAYYAGRIMLVDEEEESEESSTCPSRKRQASEVSAELDENGQKVSHQHLLDQSEDNGIPAIELFRPGGWNQSNTPAPKPAPVVKEVVERKSRKPRVREVRDDTVLNKGEQFEAPSSLAKPPYQSKKHGHMQVQRAHQLTAELPMPAATSRSVSPDAAKPRVPQNPTLGRPADGEPGGRGNDKRPEASKRPWREAPKKKTVELPAISSAEEAHASKGPRKKEERLPKIKNAGVRRVQSLPGFTQDELDAAVAAREEELWHKLQEEVNQHNKTLTRVKDLELKLRKTEQKRQSEATKQPRHGITDPTPYATAPLPLPIARERPPKLTRAVVSLPALKPISPSAEVQRRQAEVAAAAELEANALEAGEVALQTPNNGGAKMRADRSKSRAEAIKQLDSRGLNTWEVRKAEKVSRLQDMSIFSDSMWDSFYDWREAAET